MELTRREFIRLSAVAGAGVVACGRPDPDAPADAIVDASSDAGSADAATCSPTRGDAQGPFFEPGAPNRIKIAEDGEPGERFDLTGLVVTDDCATPIAGVEIDVWQADRDGNYHGAAPDQYRLRGRGTTDAAGAFRVETILPGAYLQAGGFRPAHLHFTFAHATHRPLTTQVYFAGDPYLAPNDSCATCGSDDADRILALVGNAVDGWTGELTIVLAAT